MERVAMLSIREAAYFLGVSPRTILRYCHEKRIGYHTYSKQKFLIPKEELEDFLSRTKSQSKSSCNNNRGKHSETARKRKAK